MKLYHSTTSPYVRKVMVVAIELGLADRIELVPAKVSPVVRTAPVIADNPLGKLPTLVADDGMVIFDSRVIVEHLDALAGGGRLIPASGAARWRALTDQALADGILDAALLERYEVSLRPPDNDVARMARRPARQGDEGSRPAWKRPPPASPRASTSAPSPRPARSPISTSAFPISAGAPGGRSSPAGSPPSPRARR